MDSSLEEDEAQIKLQHQGSFSFIKQQDFKIVEINQHALNRHMYVSSCFKYEISNAYLNVLQEDICEKGIAQRLRV